MYFGTVEISENFSAHHEGQLRLYETSNNFNQLLLRYGLNYFLTNQSLVTGGYAFIATSSYEKETSQVKTREHRIWEQFITRSNIGKWNLEHRYRLEQRWISSDQIEDDYTNRARYRLFLSIPLNHPRWERNTIFLALYNEIFLNLNDNPFNQNRFYAALGYEFNKSLTVQAGYLRNKIGNNEFNRLQFAVFLNTGF